MVYEASFIDDGYGGKKLDIYEPGGGTWMPCDSYIAFAFCNSEDGERMTCQIDAKGDGIKAELLPTEFFYNKTFVDIMLTAADFYGKHDTSFSEMLLQRLGFANAPDSTGWNRY